LEIQVGFERGEKMKQKLMLTALGSCCLTLAVGWAAGVLNLPNRVVLENARVKVTEINYPPGVARDRYIRAADQVIVFLDDCKYQRIDSQTHEKTVRQHKSGDVIWHNKGEDAPVLINQGSHQYRTLVVELK
jgi:hypothetical protein